MNLLGKLSRFSSLPKTRTWIQSVLPLSSNLQVTVLADSGCLADADGVMEVKFFLRWCYCESKKNAGVGEGTGCFQLNNGHNLQGKEYLQETNDMQRNEVNHGILYKCKANGCFSLPITQNISKQFIGIHMKQHVEHLTEISQQNSLNQVVLATQTSETSHTIQSCLVTKPTIQVRRKRHTSIKNSAILRALLLCTYFNPHMAQDVTLGGSSNSKVFRILGAADFDQSGESVSAAGDVNGDGIDDVIIGAFRSDVPSLNDAGIAYVIFGRNIPGGAAAFGDIQLQSGATAFSPTLGFRILGAAASDYNGWSVSGAGDVNGDGVDDVITGAYQADPVGGSNAGISYVIFGRSLAAQVTNPFGDIQLTVTPLAANIGFRILGAASGDFTGYCVSNAGDVNHDGVDDVIIGGYNTDIPSKDNAGISYVIFGRSLAAQVSNPFGDIQLTNQATALSATIGFRILGGGAEDLSGTSVSAAGDVNRDRIDDVIIGATGGDPPGRNGAGISFVVFGRNLTAPGATPFGDVLLTAGATAMSNSVGFRILGAALDDRNGFSVSGAGDVNGDGVDDVIVGAYQADPASVSNAGVSYVIFGRSLTAQISSPFGDIQLQTTAMTTGVGFRIIGASGSDNSGYSVSAAGDINGDGVDDIIVGSWHADPPSKGDAGISYVIFGRSPLAQVANPFGDIQLTTGATTLPVSIGFRIVGAGGNDNVGVSVSAAGDVNGDGIDDVIVGAWQADPVIANNNNAGISYVIFGAYATPTSQPSSQPSRQPSRQPTQQPTRQPSRQPSSQPSGQPSVQPSTQPSVQPSSQPTQPSSQPTTQPSSRPSRQPSRQPTRQPTSQPTVQPSLQPSSQPSKQPSSQPSEQPSRQPSSQPSLQPTQQPSSQPTVQPSSQPSDHPTRQPSTQPSTQPSNQPSCQPSRQPSCEPSIQPSCQPFSSPSSQPSQQPSDQPSDQPSTQPSGQPRAQPSVQPSSQPSAQPSGQPSCQPNTQPSSQPSRQPTRQPSGQPSNPPSMQPSTEPSQQPSVQPSCQPSCRPSSQPSAKPTAQPSRQPTSQPSSQPSTQPSKKPSSQPSVVPSARPSSQPSAHPSSQPSSQPSCQPSGKPSRQPSAQPVARPSNQPSSQPSSQPSVQPSLQLACAPTSQPSASPTSFPSKVAFTGEWVSLLNGRGALSHVAVVSENVWVCGTNSAANGGSNCLSMDPIFGTQKIDFPFRWTEETSILQSDEATRVAVSGRSVTGNTVTADVAACLILSTQLACTANSFEDTDIADGSYVPFVDKFIYVGAKQSISAFISIVDGFAGTKRSFLYTSTKMTSITLLHVQSPPVFFGGFIAGTCVSTSGINYIYAGMVRSDTGIMTGMYIAPSTGTIRSSAGLVNAMALEYENPDSYLAGGLQLSDGTTMQAYLLRVNSLYRQVLYGVRYIQSARRRALTVASAVTSAVKGMVLVENVLYLLINSVQTLSFVSVLKTDMTTGNILQQVQIYSHNASIQCADISTAGSFLIVACTVQYPNSTTQPVVLSVNTDLTFSSLPEGCVKTDENTLIAQRVTFKGTVLPLSMTVDDRKTTEYSFNTADGQATFRPSFGPAPRPSVSPTRLPSTAPTVAPTNQPNSSPTAAPSVSLQPSSQPSTAGPTSIFRPTVKPVARPSPVPSADPTVRPSFEPSFSPTPYPSASPTQLPSTASSVSPSTTQPTLAPSTKPTSTARPSHSPIAHSTKKPTGSPTAIPTIGGSSQQRASSAYAASATTILGYAVAGLLSALFLYQLVRWCIYKVGKVKEDNKRVGELRAQDLPGIPRYPIFRGTVGLCCALNIEKPKERTKAEPPAVLESVKSTATVATVQQTPSMDPADPVYLGQGANIDGPAKFIDLEANFPKSSNSSYSCAKKRRRKRKEKRNDDNNNIFEDSPVPTSAVVPLESIAIVNSETEEKTVLIVYLDAVAKEEEVSDLSDAEESVAPSATAEDTEPFLSPESAQSSEVASIADTAESGVESSDEGKVTYFDVTDSGDMSEHSEVINDMSFGSVEQSEGCS